MGLNVHGGGPVDCGWMESPRDGRGAGFRIGAPRQVGPLKGHSLAVCQNTRNPIQAIEHAAVPQMRLLRKGSSTFT